MKSIPHLLAVAAMLAGLAAPGIAFGAEVIPDTYPWVNVNRHHGASIRAGRLIPVTPNPGWGLGMTLKDGGVFLYGSDVSGWAVSVDGGQTFDNANSGRVFSNNVCGGYPGDWYTGDEKVVCDKPELALRPHPEGGPPSARAGFTGSTSNANSVASGPAPTELASPDVQGLCRGPTGEVGCAQEVIYAGNNSLATFSPDAGRQWFPLAPQCELRQAVSFASIAADRGKPGHVVALATNTDGLGQFEASGCTADNNTNLVAVAGYCALRTIAYTENVGEVLKASILATKLTGGNTALDGKKRFERAGGGGADEDIGGAAAWAAKPKWRYATINNLPAPKTIGGICDIGVGSVDYQVGQVMKKGAGSVVDLDNSANPNHCTAQPNHHCHGRKSSEFQEGGTPADRNAWCLDPQKKECNCTTASEANCRYPSPTHLEIDPRNGWAYLSTDVGLLTSPDGGGHWIREGQGPASNPADKLNGYLGASLITSQFNPPPSGLPGAGDVPYDLNKSPARIRSIGRMSLAFTPCPGGDSAPTYTGTSRKRGHLVAALPVEWIAPNGRPVTDVFSASELSDCDPRASVSVPGPLVFRDSPAIASPSPGSWRRPGPRPGVSLASRSTGPSGAPRL